MSTRKGPISQRDLVKVLVPLIDAARSEQSTAHRDIARTKLRELLATANWRTIFVMRSLNPRRCRWLTSQGWWVPTQYMWREYKNVDEKADPDE